MKPDETGFEYLGRDLFRERVFLRDKFKCVVCGEPAKDAHHILERRLWGNGGYYLENGASVCSAHHLEAEATTLSCSELRQLAGITKFPVPLHLYKDQEYDKWGNPLLSNGQRLKGELFNDESVQKILSPVLNLFTSKVKYPRTYHCPWSPGVTKDDRILEDLSEFEKASEVVVTVKQDGENTTFYQDYLHARSIDYDPHPSRSWVKSLHARISFDIPEGFRVCGENLYAKHSIQYQNLESYFQVFSIWNASNICLSWDDTLEWAQLLQLQTVPVLYRGKWDRKLIESLHKDTYKGDPCEGYVVRVSDSFHYKEFRTKVCKYVRKDHVQTHGHWMRSKVEPNGLKEGN